MIEERSEDQEEDTVSESMESKDGEVAIVAAPPHAFEALFSSRVRTGQSSEGSGMKEKERASRARSSLSKFR